MNYRVILHPRAIDDIAEACEFVARKSPALARRWYDRITAKIEKLAQQPTRCELAPESMHVPIELRQLLYGKRNNKFRILFSIREDEVQDDET